MIVIPDLIKRPALALCFRFTLFDLCFSFQTPIYVLLLLIVGWNDYLTMDLRLAKHGHTNHFFKTTGFVLDDLDVYKPLATVVQVVMNAAEGRTTLREAMAAVPQAIEDIKELEAAMDAENAG